MNAFFPYNKVIENQLSEIKKLLRLSMNGVTSDSMQSLGYKVNYGVSLPRIKELAKRFPENHVLAQQLWAMGYRETMIMASLLQPANSFDEKVALQWISQFYNIEQVEQCCRNLFVNLSYANKLASKMIIEEDKYKKATGYILYSFLLMQHKADESFLAFFMENASKDIYNDSFVVYSSASRFLKQAGRKNKQLVFDFLNSIHSENEQTQWVKNEVQAFLEEE